MTATDLTGRTFFITGATAGIGKATATALVDRGASLIVAARSEAKARPVIEELKNRQPKASIDFLHLDLSDLAAVKRAAESFLASGRPLDVLINNAGLAGQRALTKDGYEITFATNHLGPFLLTKLLLPKLLEAQQGRIVNVSSKAHYNVQYFKWDAFTRPATSSRQTLALYSVSKLANVLHAKELARRLSSTRVTTYSLHPGVVASDIWRELPWPVAPLIKLFMISNEEGAKTSIYCATAPELSNVSGRYYDRSREAPVNPVANDEQLAQELFTRSEEMIEKALARTSSASSKSTPQLSQSA